MPESFTVGKNNGKIGLRQPAVWQPLKIWHASYDAVSAFHPMSDQNADLISDQVCNIIKLRYIYLINRRFPVCLSLCFPCTALISFSASVHLAQQSAGISKCPAEIGRASCRERV